MKNVDITFVYDMTDQDYEDFMAWLNIALDTGIVRDIGYDIDKMSLLFYDEHEGLKFLLQWR